MIPKIRQVIFLSLIFFIPAQTGFHFWPPFSYVSGIRVDYLSPTLYFTDILIFILFLLTLLDLSKNTRKLHFLPKGKYAKYMSLFFVLNLSVGLFFSLSPESHFFKILKILEFSFLAFYVINFFEKKTSVYFAEVLAFSGIFVSVLAYWQFFKQSSIGGFFYLLGERSFNAGTIGISTMNINGSNILRPYATFPHPNVLAFFLLFVLTVLLFFVVNQKNIYEKIFFLTAIVFSSIGVLLTFSRVTILCMLFIYLVFYLKSIKGKMFKFWYLIPFLSVIAVYVFGYYSRFINLALLTRDALFRIQLIEISLAILKGNLFFGVGLNNFFFHEILYQKNVTASFLQPVHNIFILSFVELGILGGIFLPFIMLYGVYKSFKKIKAKNVLLKNFNFSILLLLFSIILIGSFDHFFLTLQQGMLMFSLVLGLSLKPKA